jgi:PLP dependent protein
VIQTVDRPKIAEALAVEIKKQGRSPKLFVQVNTGRESQKAGVMPDALPSMLTFITTTLALQVEGLMCIPPVEEDAAIHFQLLANMAKNHQLQKLSMGMSGDYQTAIKCGATHIRVGSAIFGARN